MSKFNKVLNHYLKEQENGATRAVTSPQFTQVVANVEKQAGPQADTIKALGATLMGDKHVQDFNKLLDPNNHDFKSVDDFLNKHQDLAPRFAELGLIQPKNNQPQKNENPTKNTTQNPSSMSSGNPTTDQGQENEGSAGY